MKRIGLMSDTHSYLDESMLAHFSSCDEIWHAGDLGAGRVADQLEAYKTLRAVYGNIDDLAMRQRFPEDLRFSCEGVDVFMTHIGGYPGKYDPRVRRLLSEDTPKLFICGHSHILKIVPDPKLGLLHINPGACGHEGFHLIRTMVRFSVENGKISDMEVIELGRRGRH